MAGKARNVSSKKVSLETIEEQLEEIKRCLKRQDKKLEQQDKRRNQSLWLSFAIVGIPMMLVGITLRAQSLDFAIVTGCIIFLLGVAVLLGGILGVFLCSSRIAKK